MHSETLDPEHQRVCLGLGSHDAIIFSVKHTSINLTEVSITER